MSPWRDLFKFGSGGTRLKPDPRLRWFGKLPTYADYYTSANDAEWTVEFNDWLLKGFELYHHRQHETAAHGKRPHLPISACMIRLPESGMTVLASIQDYGGDMRGRSFPLAFYVGLPTDQCLGPTSASVGPALDVLQRLNDLRHEVIRFFKAPSRFEGVFGDREIPLDSLANPTSEDGWRPQADGLSLAEWFEGVKADLTTADLPLWVKLTREWGQAIAGLQSESFEPTLCFPLAMGKPLLGSQIAGWLRWLESYMSLADRACTLIYTAEAEAGSAGRLCVVARAPVPEDFLLMTPLCKGLSYLDDLSAVKEKESSADQAPAGATAGPGATAVLPQTWAEFIAGQPLAFRG